MTQISSSKHSASILGSSRLRTKSESIECGEAQDESEGLCIHRVHITYNPATDDLLVKNNHYIITGNVCPIELNNHSFGLYISVLRLGISFPRAFCALPPAIHTRRVSCCLSQQIIIIYFDGEFTYLVDRGKHFQ